MEVREMIFSDLGFCDCSVGIKFGERGQKHEIQHKVITVAQ